MLEGKVGYVRLLNFYDHSAQRLEEAVTQLREQGAEALVFDMRNNGGGYLSQLTDMLDFLLPEGPIFISRDRAGHEEITNSDADCVELPMAVLVNADTYSAAEFFAAELQEQGAAVIVGEPTSGKGYSQQTFPLPHGGAVAISTGAYFTGSGALPHRHRPDPGRGGIQHRSGGCSTGRRAGIAGNPVKSLDCKPT